MEIFSGLSVPKTATRGISAKYPTNKLEVGQCFFAEPKEGETLSKAVKRLSGTTQRSRKDDKARKYAVRATQHPETGVDCVGIWRIA